ncbi:MAG: hypothetical protein JXR03_06470 [Cyclobacteriaceae bacterium]
MIIDTQASTPDAITFDELIAKEETKEARKYLWLIMLGSELNSLNDNEKLCLK